QRPGILDLLLSHSAKARIDCRVVHIGRNAMKNAAGAKALAEPRKIRWIGIVRQLRLFLGVEVVEIAEELIETVHGWQELVAIAQMVLAELARDVTQRLQ